jgi:hypothetical protein
MYKLMIRAYDFWQTVKTFPCTIIERIVGDRLLWVSFTSPVVYYLYGGRLHRAICSYGRLHFQLIRTLRFTIPIKEPTVIQVIKVYKDKRTDVTDTVLKYQGPFNDFYQYTAYKFLIEDLVYCIGEFEYLEVTNSRCNTFTLKKNSHFRTIK